VEAALAEGKKAMESNNADTMKAAQEQLTKASHKLAEAMYKATAAQTPPAGGPDANAGAESAPPPPPKDNVVDAEFVDVDDSKKK